jgi:hypothetical protein
MMVEPAEWAAMAGAYWLWIEAEPEAKAPEALTVRV